MEISEFSKIISKICNRDTSSNPDDWTPENPTYGHCAIVSVLAQDMFGGTIARVSLVGTPYEKMHSHYFNVIDGVEHDFTLSQFNENPCAKSKREERSQAEILSSLNTKKRFDLLKGRFTLSSK